MTPLLFGFLLGLLIGFGIGVVVGVYLTFREFKKQSDRIMGN